VLRVHELLHQTFLDQWKEGTGQSHGHHITPLDFLLWCYVKDIVYRTMIRDIADLKQKISDPIATIDVDMLQRTWQEIEDWLDVLRATIGAHIEAH